MDNINEALNDLAPSQPLSLSGQTLGPTGPGSTIYSGNASDGAGLFYKSAAGEDIDATYTGGAIILTDDLQLVTPTTGDRESGGEKASLSSDQGSRCGALKLPAPAS